MDIKNAADKFEFIKTHLEAGRTVYLATALRVTSLKLKNLPQVRVRNGSLEIQCGKRWIDYSYTQISAR